MGDNQPNEFEKAAAEEAELGFFAELFAFLKHNKKWWLMPVLVVLLLLGALMLVPAGLVPFIYTLF